MPRPTVVRRSPRLNVRVRSRRALRAVRKDVEAVYIDGGQHNGLFANTAQYDATVRCVAKFLRRHLER